MFRTSEAVDKIFPAFIKAKSQLVQPMKDADNPFFKSKYVPLPNVVDAVDNALKETGLAFIQTGGEYKEGTISVTTIVIHESGQFIEFEPMSLPLEKATAQGAGSAVTYLKRYALGAIFGITESVDDDGNAASSKAAKEDTTAIKAKLRDVAKLANSKGKSDLVDRARTAAKIPDAKKMKEALDAIQKELD